ncbi:MAG: hypothetical protein SangKO_074090 [Sandaracinaceae bacterium]
MIDGDRVPDAAAELHAAGRDGGRSEHTHHRQELSPLRRVASWCEDRGANQPAPVYPAVAIERTTVASAAVASAAVASAAVDPAAIDPATVDPATVDSAAVDLHMATAVDRTVAPREHEHAQ